jgi:hypothetical protein
LPVGQGPHAPEARGRLNGDESDDCAPERTRGLEGAEIGDHARAAAGIEATDGEPAGHHRAHGRKRLSPLKSGRVQRD